MTKFTVTFKRTITMTVTREAASRAALRAEIEQYGVGEFAIDAGTDQDDITKITKIEVTEDGEG